MGNMKYPIGIQSFEKIITEGYLYIDKTQMIYDMVENGKIYFLSRPRRFGKSLLVSTLECYFQGRKELFKGLAIDNLETNWKQYAVFHLDFNGKDFTQAGQLEKTLIDFVESQEAIYGKAPFASTLGDRFIGVLRNAHEKTGLRAVVLIDEYDKPLLDVLDSTLKTTDADGNERLLEDRHREILKGFYSVFKAADKDLQFVLLTGVTKFSQVSVFSGFNQPEDISLSAHFDTLLGITEDELQSTFAQQITEMAEEYDVSKEEILIKLKRQFSILRAFKEMLIDDYWFQTGSPSYLVRLLVHSDENINELVGKYYPTNCFEELSIDCPLSIIFQNGYLTIKEWVRNTNSYLLDFPNDEARRGFVSLLAASKTGTIDDWGEN